MMMSQEVSPNPCLATYGTTSDETKRDKLRSISLKLYNGNCVLAAHVRMKEILGECLAFCNGQEPQGEPRHSTRCGKESLDSTLSCARIQDGKS